MFRIPNKIDYNFIIKLKTIIKDDIEVLSHMIQASEQGSGYYELIKSLILAKYELNNLASSYNMSDSKYPNPPIQLPLEQYDDYKRLPHKDIGMVVNIISKIEMDQMHFIRDVIRSGKAPKEIENVLQAMLKIYFKITVQLKRMTTVKKYAALNY